MKSIFRTLGGIWLIVFGLVAVVAIWHFWSDLWIQFDRPLRISASNIIAVAILQIVFWILLAFLWNRILFMVGIKNMPLAVCFWQQMLVMLGKYVPGKIWGIVVRGHEMTRRGDKLAQIATATYLEQQFLLHSGMVVAALILTLLLPTSWWTATLAVSAVVTVPLGARFSSKSLRLFSTLVHKLGRADPKPVEFRLALGPYALILATYGALWILSGVIFAVLSMMFIETDIDSELVFALILSNIAGIVVGFLALFAPGGIGVREGVTLSLLLPYMPIGQAMFLTLFARLWQIATDVIGGLLGLWFMRQNQNRAKSQL